MLKWLRVSRVICIFRNYERGEEVKRVTYS